MVDNSSDNVVLTFEQQQKVEMSKKRLAVVQDEVLNATKELAGIRADITTAEERIAYLSAELPVVEKKVAEANAEHVSVMGSIQAMKASIDTMRTEHAKEHAAHEALDADLRAREQAIISDEKRIEKREAKLRSDTDELETKKTKVEDAADALVQAAAHITWK